VLEQEVSRKAPNSPLKGKTRVESLREFESTKLRRNSAFAHRIPTERNNRPRLFEVQASDKAQER
jgi:hypothetical protein